MKTLATAFASVATLVVPALCYAHAGHGPEPGIAHELIHAQWLLLGVGCLAVFALVRKSRQHPGAQHRRVR